MMDEDNSGDEEEQAANQGNDEAGNSKESIVFYIYTGVGSQSVVFKRRYSDIS